MLKQLHNDEQSFRRLLQRNIALPLIAGIVTALAFVGLLFYLLSSMSWVEHSERVIGSSNEVTKLAVDMETGLRGYLLTGNPVSLEPYLLSKPIVATELASLLKAVSDNPAQIERLNKVRGMLAQWDNFAQSAITLKRTKGDIDEIVRANVGKTQFDQIRREITAFRTIEERLRQDRIESARSVTYFAIATFLFISLSLSALLAYLGRRELTQLASTYGTALKEQIAHAEVLQEQAWIRAGQVQLAERSVGQQALPVLSRSILDFLAFYSNAKVGALYVRGERGSMRRIAAYGFSSEQERAVQVFHNDSLVAQAALEQRIIHLANVPPDYIKVTSGLGDATSTHVVIVPFDNEGDTNGVLELGFLQPVEPRIISFFNVIAGNIGTSIEAARYRQRLQDSLSETQQLNEELQVQQEELRSSNEELEEQSRVLEESQAHLENQKAELEQTNRQMASQADVLDQKNATLNTIQLELEERAEELQQASKYKSEFLANMSHELRTPLNSSLILAKLLSDNAKGNLTEEQVKFAQTIYSAGNDLLELINDILDISKVEAGKLELAPENVQVDDLLDSLKTTFERIAEQKKLEFIIQIAPDTTSTLFTDRQRIEQILKNLLSNALKFTEQGFVRLLISQNASGHFQFIVKDSGIGISQENQSFIFEAFRQIDGAINRRFDGTGLGLSIARDLATLLGGSIDVFSRENEGSTFTLVLPAVWRGSENVEQKRTSAKNPLNVSIQNNPAPTTVSDRFDTASSQNIQDDRDLNIVRGTDRVALVIEDDDTFAAILLEIAREMNYRCLVCSSADAGLRMALDYLPDAILLDIGLPDRSGLTLLEQLKTNSLTRHIPVHVVSAKDRTDTALQLGAIGYAIKPTTREQLVDVFNKLESKFTQTIKRVLLVEDDERQRESILALIEDDDIEITAVEYGEDALHHLRNTIYDCMIIDLKLPDMQGGQLLQRMSLEEICSFPPVIVYTGRNLTREEEANLQKYSRSIIIKGARSPERLLDEVTLFLHKVESKLSTERQAILQTVRNRDQIFEGRRVLLVDDDVRNIFALSSVLEQRGLSVEIARNGFEAISKLDEIPDIDLVLMDIMMPGMDGLEATRRIRSDSRFRALPIIAVTAKAMKDDQEQCMKAGANDYLAKPVDVGRLYSLLRVWMPGIERLK